MEQDRLPSPQQSSEHLSVSSKVDSLDVAIVKKWQPDSAGQPRGDRPRWFAWLLWQPLLAILLTTLMVIGGLLGYGALVKEGTPDLEIAIALVQTDWSGSDAENIERQVTQPIEDEVKAVEAIHKLRSASYSGVSVVEVEFSARADVGESLQQLREAVALARSHFPAGVEAPQIQQFSINDKPILRLALSGPVDPVLLSQTAVQLQRRLEAVPGVNQVFLGGDRTEVIQIQLDPLRLSQLEISPQSVALAIQQANQDVPLDELESDFMGGQLRFYGQFRQLADLRSLPIARLGSGGANSIARGAGLANQGLGSTGRTVLLGEVASITREFAQADSSVSISQDGASYLPAVMLHLTRAPGEDSPRLIEAVLAELESEKTGGAWPQGLDCRVVFDESELIWSELRGLAGNVIQAAIAVFIILMLTLSWREGAIASLAIPLTFLGALAVLWLVGQTLNTIVLMGMILALGLLVDVFILIMEGMHGAMLEEGLSFEQAVLQTVSHYAFPTLAGQLTTILAMAPLMGLQGKLGSFIRILPITVIICLCLSFLIAFCVALPLSRYLLGGSNRKGRRLMHRKRPMERMMFNCAQYFSHWSRRWLLRSRSTAIAWVGGALAVCGLSLLLCSQLSMGFFPLPDGRLASINLELPPAATRAEAESVAYEVGELLRQKPFFQTVIKDVGQHSKAVSLQDFSPRLDNDLVGFSVVFRPQGQWDAAGEFRRERYSFEYLEELRDELNALLVNHPGVTAVLTGEQTASYEEPIQIELQGERTEVLRQLSGEVQAALRRIDGVRDVRDDQGALLPDIKLLPQREALDFYGLSAADLAQQARYYTSSTDVGDFVPSGERETLEMLLSTAWPSRQGTVGGPTRPEELLTMRFFGHDPRRSPIPASAVVKMVRGEMPLSIPRRAGRRTVTILAKVNQGQTAGDVMALLEPNLQQLQRSWPAGYGYHLAGEVEEQAETFASAGRAMILAILLVFSVLVLQFQSFRQPLIILLSVPFALVGVIWGFYGFDITFSFPAFVGVIAMVGIVVNDAIVMVDTMNRHRGEGLRLREAALVGIGDRFRPILTTSLTTIVSLIPLALTNPTWMPLASAIIFGLIAATVTALVIIPCLYILLSPDQSLTVVDK